MSAASRSNVTKKITIASRWGPLKSPFARDCDKSRIHHWAATPDPRKRTRSRMFSGGNTRNSMKAVPGSRRYTPQPIHSRALRESLFKIPRDNYLLMIIASSIHGDSIN